MRMQTLKTFDASEPTFGDVTAALRGNPWSVCRGERPGLEERQEPAEEVLAALRQLPETATLRDVVEAVLGERPTGHGQTYANVVTTQRALGRLAELVAGRAFSPWEPAP
jgi:hypothetical protein